MPFFIVRINAHSEFPAKIRLLCFKILDKNQDLSKIEIYTGSNTKKRGKKSTVQKIIKHLSYGLPHEKNDIGKLKYI